MDKKEIEEIKATILAEIEKTNKRIKSTQEMAASIEPDDAIGRISRMDAINNKTVTDASIRKAKEKVKQLTYMLEQVGTDDFGICVKCKAKIPIGRLMLMPESRFCVNCA
jgi:DnaK suppressor protein